MDTANLLRAARLAAGLTQSELSKRAGTSQTAVAAYESGAKTPTIATLERLLSCSEFDLELHAQPRMRRGALSLADIAHMVRSDPLSTSDSAFMRLVLGFADDFIGSSRPGKSALINTEPEMTGIPRYDAALAGVGEFLARQACISIPPWVDGSERFVEPWWISAPTPGLHPYVFARTHAEIARHGVFIAREVFDRV